MGKFIKEWISPLDSYGFIMGKLRIFYFPQYKLNTKHTYAAIFRKGDVGNAILDTKSKIVLALFSVCNKQTGVN